MYVVRFFLNDDYLDQLFLAITKTKMNLKKHYPQVVFIAKKPLKRDHNSVKFSLKYAISPSMEPISQVRIPENKWPIASFILFLFFTMTVRKYIV